MIPQRHEIEEHWLTVDAQHDLAMLGAAGYETLLNVLRRAFLQAAHGKGAERHAQGAPFDQQPMQRLIELYGVGFALGQAAKKAQESQRLPHERAVAELLGAINYLAGAVIAMERKPRIDPDKEKAAAKMAEASGLVARAHANDNERGCVMVPHIGPVCCGTPSPSYCQGCPRV